MAKEQVSSILRALQILECFMDRETEWTLKELVDHLDLPFYHGVSARCPLWQSGSIWCRTLSARAIGWDRD